MQIENKKKMINSVACEKSSSLATCIQVRLAEKAQHSPKTD